MTFKALLVPAFLLASAIGFSQEGNLLPQIPPGKDLKIVPEKESLLVKSSAGRVFMAIRANSRSLESGMKLSLEPCADFSEETTAFKVETVAMSTDTKEYALIRFQGVKDVPKGRDCVVSIWMKASADGAPATLMFEGETADGKHFWRAKEIAATVKWTKYEFETHIPDTMKSLWLRLDCQPGFVFYLQRPGLAVVKKEVEATANDPKRNLLLNGDAESGWYGTQLGSPEELTPVRGQVVTHYGGNGGVVLEKPFANWTLDDKVFFSGRHSFRWEHDSKSATLNGLLFNPVPFEIGKPASFSVMLKGDRKLKANIGLFLGSGVAYAKDISIDTNWKEYRLDVPVWGEKIPGVARIGDVAYGYCAGLALAYPSVNFSGPGTAWIDNAQYRLSLEPSTPENGTLHVRGGLDSLTRTYQPSQAVEASYEIVNDSASKRELDASYVLTDYFAKRIAASPVRRLSVEPNSSAKLNYTLKPDHLGPMILTLKVRDGKDEVVRSDYFGVYERAAKLDPWYGIDVGARVNAEIAAKCFKDFGIGSVRLWSTYKDVLGRNQGFDDVPTYKRNGLSILFNLSDFDPVAPSGTVPRDLSAWTESLKGDMLRNKGLVDYYELCNEPNIWRAPKEKFDEGKFEYMSPQAYARAAEAASKLIKGNDPHAKLVGPTTCHTDVIWTSNALAAGASKYLDIVTEHPYRNKPEAPDYEADLDALKAVLAKTGGKQAIFASECGEQFPATSESDVVTPKVRDAADRSIRMALIAYANGVEKYIHFAGNAPKGTGFCVFYSGNPDNACMTIPGPFLYAFRNMQIRLDGAKPLGKCKLGTALRCYVFEREGRRVAALWKCQDEEKPSVCTFKAETVPFELFDIMGNRLELAHKGYEYSFAITPSPTYLETSLTLEELQRLFSQATITGVGAPLNVSLAVVDQGRFAIDVENRSNKAISGRTEILTKSLVKSAPLCSFSNLLPGEKARLLFTTSNPISTKPSKVRARTVLEGADAFDSSEFELKTMLCRKAEAPIKLDGDLSRWPSNAETFTLDSSNVYKSDATLWKPGDERIHAEIRTAWRDDGLYLAVTVFKPKYVNDAKGPMELWKFDGIQIAFDPLKNGKKAQDNDYLYDDDDFEYSIGLLNGKTCVYRHRASSVVYDGLGKNVGDVTGEVQAVVKPMDGKTVYEMKFPASAVSPFRLEKGASMRWSMIVNLNNGEGRMGWLELTRGIGQCKSPGEFLDIVLVE